jgi:hypothetical protein
MLGDLRVFIRFQEGTEFVLLHRVQTGYRAYPAPYPMRIGDSLSPEIKRPAHKAHHLSISSAEVKNR